MNAMNPCTPPNTDQVYKLKLVLDAVVDAVKAGGAMGAPGGIIYAAMMARGCTLANYEAIMAALVRVGKIRRSGDLYFSVGG